MDTHPAELADKHMPASKGRIEAVLQGNAPTPSQLGLKPYLTLSILQSPKWKLVTLGDTFFPTKFPSRLKLILMDIKGPKSTLLTWSLGRAQREQTDTWPMYFRDP
jgi:hypothetical protein